MSDLVYRYIDTIKRKPVSNFKRYVYAEIEIKIRKYYEMRML